MSAGKFRQYRPPGPVAAAFLSDRTSKVKLLRGPVGGGKTVTCIFDPLAHAAMMMPICRDGIIHFRLAVIGVTYGQLERNLYPSWKFWLPPGADNEWTESEWAGGGGRFATHKIKFDTVRGGRRVPVDFEAIFAAIGEQSVEQFMRGFEPSAWYLFEVDQAPDGIIEQAVGRLGRYPNAEMLRPGDSYHSYVMGDLNSPDIDSWYYRTVEEVKPKGWRQFVQPSGLSPKAENTQNLPKNYYRDLYEQNAHRKRWTKRFILNEYGPSDLGEPVYGDEWSDDIHYAPDPIEPIKGVDLLLGFDQGLSFPAAVLAQRTSRGQWRVLGEVAEGRMNERRFAALVRQMIEEVAPNFPLPTIGYADPAGFDGADKEAGELAWAEIVAEELGIAILPAPSNEIQLRLTAVRDELTYMIDAHTPALIVSPRCRMLRKGFASHYMYEKRPAEKSQQRKPVKNIYSNPHDALQYLMLGVKGRYGVIEGPRSAAKQTAPGNERSSGGCHVLKAPVVV